MVHQCGIPGRLMFKHGVDDRQQLAHAGHEGYLLGFAGRQQSLVERADHRIEPRGDDCCHIQGGPDTGAPSPDSATAPQGPAITIERGDADQCGNLFLREGAQFREIRQQRGGQDRTDARHTAQQRLLLSPDWTLANGLGQIGISLLQGPFKPRDMGAQILPDGGAGTHQAVFFSCQHLDELLPARHQRGQGLSLLVGQRPQFWPNHFGEPSQHVSINGVGLGQLSGGFGKITYLARIDDDHRQPDQHQCTGQRQLHAARRFQDHQRRRHSLQPFTELSPPLFIIYNCKASFRPHRHIQLGLRHIDADKDWGVRNHRLLGRPALQNAGSGAQATVRALQVTSVTTQAVPRSRGPRLRRSITLGVTVCRSMERADVRYKAIYEDGLVIAMRWHQLVREFGDDLGAKKFQEAMPSLIEQNSQRRIMSQNERRHIYVNCWYLGDLESEAMWRLYCPNNNGVAIQTSYSKLVESVANDSELYIGRVTYIDYDSQTLPSGNLFYPVMHKRISFAHEQEVRLVKLMIPDNLGLPHEFCPPGIPVDWPLEPTVDAIYVDPYAPEYFHNVVRLVVRRVTPSLEDRVLWSPMKASPVF